MLPTRSFSSISNALSFCFAIGGFLCIFYSSPTLGLPQQNSVQSSLYSNGSRVVDSLKFVAVVTSHGNVAPTFTYSANPYPTHDTRYWPFGEGEVTKAGRNKLYALGSKIRTLYNGFVDKYSEDDFIASSSEVDRTMISGQLFTAGLFVPVGYEVWNPTLLWQPVFVNLDSSDKTLDVTGCPRFVNESKTSISKFENQYSSNITEISNYLTKSTGTSVSGAEAIASVWEMLHSQKAEGLAELSWATEECFNQIKSLIGRYYVDYFAGSDEAVRLVIGTLFEEIMSAMKNFEKLSYVYEKSYDPEVEDWPTGWPYYTPQKFIFYSGYNASLITLQAVLASSPENIVSPVNPGSAMIFELHENSTTNKNYIKVLWVDGGLGAEPSDPVEINISNCGTSCDLTTFSDLTEKFNITSYESECNTPNV